MDHALVRSLIFLFAFAGAAPRPAHAGQPYVKSLAHDEGARSTWANEDRNRWRKALLGKKDGKSFRLAPLRSRQSNAAASAPHS